MASGLQGAGSFSVDINGAANMNGNAAIDGSINQGTQNEGTDMKTINQGSQTSQAHQASQDDQVISQGDLAGQAIMRNILDIDAGQGNLRTIGANGARKEVLEANDVNVVSGYQYGNMNVQSSIYQYGSGNSNSQGGITQTLRRQNLPIQQFPNQHIVCGYRSKIVYPSLRRQNSNVQSGINQSGWGNSNEQTSVGQNVYVVRRRYN